MVTYRPNIVFDKGGKVPCNWLYSKFKYSTDADNGGIVECNKLNDKSLQTKTKHQIRQKYCIL